MQRLFGRGTGRFTGAPASPFDDKESSMTQIKKVAVIGAGTMGGGIAAHCINAGLQVVLLDTVPSSLTPKKKTRSDARVEGGAQPLRPGRSGADQKRSPGSALRSAVDLPDRDR